MDTEAVLLSKMPHFPPHLLYVGRTDMARIQTLVVKFEINLIDIEKWQMTLGSSDIPLLSDIDIIWFGLFNWKGATFRSWKCLNNVGMHKGRYAANKFIVCFVWGFVVFCSCNLTKKLVAIKQSRICVNCSFYAITSAVSFLKDIT